MTSSSDADERPVLLEARDIVVHYGRIEALGSKRCTESPWWCARASW